MLWYIICQPNVALSQQNANDIARDTSVYISGITDRKSPLKFYAGSYALVIGISDYKFFGSRENSWSPLSGVKKDVIAIEEALSGAFKVERAEDLDDRDLRNRLAEFIDKYGKNPENRLLIYFAGHGDLLRIDGREVGFIVTKNSPRVRRDPQTNVPVEDYQEFTRRALSMREFRDYVKKIEARHALFVFDSCFSGSVLREMEGSRVASQAVLPGLTGTGLAFLPPEPSVTRPVEPAINVASVLPVRMFITSGTNWQEVQDDSAFRRAFVRAIGRDSQRPADSNRDYYVTGPELWRFLSREVTAREGIAQLPQYGVIDEPERDEGSYVFELPGATKKTIPLDVDGNLWDLSGGQWEVTGRGLHTLGSGILLPKEPHRYSYRDLRITAVVRLEKDSAAKFVLRAQGASDYYLVEMSGGGSANQALRHKLRAYVVREGRKRELKVPPPSINETNLKKLLSDGKPVKVDIKLYANSIRVQLWDGERPILLVGETVFLIENDIYEFGTVGFLSEGEDRFTVSKFSVESCDH
jgi:hypothetical protein